MNGIVAALGAGTGLQVLMVLVGHFVPRLQEFGLFPIAGTLIGLVTGIVAGGGSGGKRATASAPSAAAGVTSAAPGGAASVLTGAISAGVAGSIGSLVSSALGDVPLSNVLIAGGSTVVMGAIGTSLRRRLAARVPALAEKAENV